MAPVAIPGAVSTPDVRAAARAFLAQQSEHFDQPVMLMHLDTVEAKSARQDGAVWQGVSILLWGFRQCSAVSSAAQTEFQRLATENHKA